MDDRELVRMHVEALFTHDAAGRMIRVNEPDGGPAPRFYLGRTAHGGVRRFRQDLDEGLVHALESLCLAEPAGEEFPHPPYGATKYQDLLGPAGRTWAGPAYCFPHAPSASPGAVLVTENNADLLRLHLEAWVGDVAHRQPMLAVLDGGHAVSVCCSVRVASRAHEAGVETAPGFRGRGLAARVVAAWAAAVAGIGRVPLYSTSWENAASRGVARTLGLRRYAADLHVT